MTRTISQLAKTLGISVETVRYYERRGLIPQPPKPLNGYRHYSDEIVKRIRFIKGAQALGFTLEEVSGLLSLHDQRCNQVQALAEQKLENVKQKIADLQRLETALSALVSACCHNEDQAHCPIIESLQS